MHWMISNLEGVVELDWKLNFIRSINDMTQEELDQYVERLKQKRHELLEAVKFTVKNMEE